MKKPVLQMAATADSLWLPSPWPKYFLLSNRILFVFEVAMGPDSETQFQVSLQRHMALTSVVASLNEDSYFSDRLQAGGKGPTFSSSFSSHGNIDRTLAATLSLLGGTKN